MALKRESTSGSSTAKRRRSLRSAAATLPTKDCTLESLPSELITQILDQLSPDDFSAAYITSRTMYTFAANLLVTHRNFRSQYTVLDRSDAHATPTLSRLLGTFVLNPRIALFPKTLRVGRLHTAWGNSAPFPQSVHAELQDAVDLYARRGQGGLPDANWAQRFWSGHEEMALLMLLCILPNLEVLELLEIPERFMTIYGRVAHLLKQQVSHGDTRTIFTKLRIVSMPGNSVPEYRNLGLVEGFANMHSMEEVSIDNVQEEEEVGDKYFKDFSSPAKRLIFQNPCLTQELTFNFLRQFRGLEYFCWDERQSQAFDHDTFDPPITPFWLCVALSAHACKSTLRRLEIRVQDPENAFLGDLTSLQNLRSLGADLCAIMNHSTQEAIRLSDSVTELTVYCDHGTTRSTRTKTRETLKQFLRSNLLEAESLETLNMEATITPRGGKISVDRACKIMGIYRKIKRRSKKVGVRFHIKFWINGMEWTYPESRSALSMHMWVSQ